jgi:DNA replication initiation complex subunit (GINS family)
MMGYDELYEYLRKEKYGEQLQPLPKNFISDVSTFLKGQQTQLNNNPDLFSDDLLKAKKQFENSISLFREVIRIRKKKILDLVFVASETGIMKRDFSTLLSFEQELFESLVSTVDKAGKDVQGLLNGDSEKKSLHKMIIVSQEIGEFVDHSGAVIGPFEKGVLVNLDAPIAEILVSEGKANYIDA